MEKFNNNGFNKSYNNNEKINAVVNNVQAADPAPQTSPAVSNPEPSRMADAIQNMIGFVKDHKIGIASGVAISGLLIAELKTKFIRNKMNALFKKKHADEFEEVVEETAK